MVFQDEFSGTALDSSKWDNCWKYGNSCVNVVGVATNPNNVRVANGNAELTLSSSNSGATISGKGHWTFKAGTVIESRASLVASGGQCADWGGFWTTADSPEPFAEHDVVETLSGKASTNYHSPNSNLVNPIGSQYCGGFHVFTAYIKAATTDVYYDGALVKTYNNNDGNPNAYMLFSIGNGQGDPTVIGGKNLVDYVRAWVPA